jgi:hypothetical protein
VRQIRLLLPVFAAFTLAVTACAIRPLALSATPTPAVPQFCQLSVTGRQVKDVNGNTVVLHGATLPTLTEMEASDRPPAQRLGELAQAGAKAVRLLVDDKELTPTFVPSKVSPFIDQANALGLLVILAFRNNAQDDVNTQADNAEDWLRLVLGYLRASPGVWFEPFTSAIDTPKWEDIAQRMVDVMRGYRAGQVIVVPNPEWLRMPGTIPLRGGNIVYAVDALEGWPVDAAPFVLSGVKAQDARDVQAAGVWSIAAEDADVLALEPLWRSSQTCR